MKEYAGNLLERDSVCWIGDSAVYDKRTFRKHCTPQWLVIMLCKGGIPDEFLRQMRFYHKHDQQKENDPDNKPTTASHTSPPFLI